MFNENNVAYSLELKFLGLFVTENLAWHVQIHSLCSSPSKVYYLVKSVRDVMSIHMLWSVYFAHFQLRLRYGIIFWGRDDETIRVFRIQKKVLQLITAYINMSPIGKFLRNSEF
jgi:hypothetical protein